VSAFVKEPVLGALLSLLNVSAFVLIMEFVRHSILSTRLHVSANGVHRFLAHQCTNGTLLGADVRYARTTVRLDLD
jgi:hypothetical protein